MYNNTSQQNFLRNTPNIKFIKKYCILPRLYVI